MSGIRKMSAALVCSAMMMTACADIVVKVTKKPKNVDQSALQNFEALNLDDPTKADFLKHLDNLKIIAADLLIKELNRRDYRTEIRGAIRKYRKFLIDRANGDIKVDDSFYYAQGEQCRESGLNFNMHNSNEMLGLILKTAVLSKISEVNAGKLNPGLSKEIAAIGQLILKELQIEIAGDVDVLKDGETTTTSGKFKLKLLPIESEAVDEATKLADAAEALEMSFKRTLGKEYIGSFEADISIGHALPDNKVETIAAHLGIKREAVEGMFLHTIDFDLGVVGSPSKYSRQLTFKQMPENKRQIQMTDTLNYKNEATKHSFITLIDLDAGTQCKLVVGNEPPVYEPTATETATQTSTESSTSTDTDTDTDTSTSTATSTGSSPTVTVTVTNTDTVTNTVTVTNTSTVTVVATSTVTATSTSTDYCKGKSCDDDDYGSGSGGTPTQTPGQQSPTQGK